jgi:hypothetical protein
MDVSARLAAVARSTDGHGLGLYSLVAKVLPGASSGAGAWKDALNRNERLGEADRREVPTTYLGKVEGNRQTTRIVRFELAPSVVSFVLKDPLEDFFQNDEAREALAQLAGRAPTEAVATSLVAAATELARAQECLLPALPGRELAVGSKLRTAKRDGQILGSVRDFVEWLGLDRANTWDNWLQAAFLAELNAVTLSCANCGGIRDQIRKPVLEHVVLPGASLATPMTNYTGFCLIIRLCAGRSAISDAVIDEATNALGRLKVGDQTLHREIDQNAASASSEARQFVLGDSLVGEEGSTDDLLESSESHSGDVVSVVQSRPVKRQRLGTDPARWGEQVVSIQGTLKLWGVHPAVLKAYTSDVANALLALKCKQRDGSFSAVRLWGPLYRARKYLPSDEALLREAVVATRELLKKRILDLRRELAHNARTADRIGV